MATIIREYAGRRKIALTEKVIDYNVVITHDVYKLIHPGISGYQIVPRNNFKSHFDREKSPGLNESDLQDKLDKIESSSRIKVVAIIK